MNDDPEDLIRQLESARAEYQRIGKPILDRIVDISKKVADIKREREELYYVDYLRYSCPYTEECDTLEEAREYADSLNDAGDGYVTGIRGPGISLGEHDWHAP